MSDGQSAVRNAKPIAGMIRLRCNLDDADAEAKLSESREKVMRIAIVTVAGIVGAALLASVAGAVTPPKPMSRDIENFQPVAEGCGYGWHWVGGYRRSDGAWIPGHCQRNP
jgi:hypothetical protein